MEGPVNHAHRPSLSEAETRLPQGHFWGKLPQIAGAIGIAALAASYALSGQYPAKQFYFSYLTAYLFWLSLALGGLFFVIVQFAAKAGWSVTVRRLAENAMLTLPLFALLFLPIAINGAHELFHWAHPDHVAHDPVLQGKAAYLNLPFFYARAVAYFVCWTALALYYFRNSVTQDRTGDHRITSRLQWASGPATVVFALTVTFAAFDWIMSLDPHWYSTIYGVYYFSGCVVAIFAFLSVVGVLLRYGGVLKQAITIEHYHDLGKLLFAFTVFWTYIAFSQFMLQWYANLPEETVWFAHRGHGSWKTLSIVLGVGHFGAPFFFLMTRSTKRNCVTLLLGSLWMLAVHYLDLFWLVMPSLHHEGVQLTLLDLTTALGIGGLFVAVFSIPLKRHALVPTKDPRLPQSLSFENY